MKRLFWLLTVVCLVALPIMAQETATVRSSESDQLWAVFQQIRDLDAAGHEVPADLYNRYYELDRIVNPSQYEWERTPGNPLDQLTDYCDQAPTWVGPDEGMTYFNATNGVTSSAFHNDCTYLNGGAAGCRLGKDVFMKLEVRFRDSVTVSTCGSAFDTYLCIFTDGCCATPFAQNNNNSLICGVATTLNAAISRCFDPGMYWICLDGSSGTAFGDWRISVQFHGNSCIYEEPEPECPDDYAIHEETFTEGCSEYSNDIHCGQGYCGQIDALGDLDVYSLVVSDCERSVTVSVFADDTPGRTGFEGGLNSFLRVWPATCEAPLMVNDNFNGNVDIGQPGGTDSQLTIDLVPGTYFFEVSGAAATSGPYEIFVQPCDCEGL